MSSFKQKCIEQNVDYWRALKRRASGMPDSKIFAPGYIGGSRETKSITVHGVSYPNLKEASRALKPRASIKTIRRWISAGVPPEEAFARVPNPGYANGIVYCVTHKDSGKQYIGITVQGLRSRWHNHIEQAHSGYIKSSRSLHAAIREYGPEAFDVDQVDVGFSKGDLEGKERAYIVERNTLIPRGFNISTGGISGGSNKKQTLVEGKLFASQRAAISHVVATKRISAHAAKKRIQSGRVNVKKPAKPGESLIKTPAYKAWGNIKSCYTNPAAKDYIAGITMHPAWQEFDAFLTDMGQPPKQGMCCARIDKSKGFTPNNTRWMTKSESSRINAAYMKKQGSLVGRRGKIES